MAAKKDKKAAAAVTTTRRRPKVEHIINDHAGTVLDEPEPAPSLTRPEEKRVITAYHEAVEDYVIELLARAKGINIGGDDTDVIDSTPSFQTKAFDVDGDQGEEGGVGGLNSDGKADEPLDTSSRPPSSGGGAKREEEEGEEDEEEDEAAQAARQAKRAMAAQAAAKEEEMLLKNSRAKAEKGITLKGTRKALISLDINMNDAQFAKHVETFFKDHDLMDPSEGGLELDGFIALVSMVYAPGHKFGSRLRKACCRADNTRVRDLMARGCNPLGYDGGGFSCLHYAAQSGHVSTCEILLEFAHNPPEAFVSMLPESQQANQAPPSPTGSEKSDLSGVMDHGTDHQGQSSSRKGGSTHHSSLASKGGSVVSGDASAASSHHHGTGGTGQASGGGGGSDAVVSKHGLYYKAMLEARDNSGWTPLMVASSRGEVAVMNYLIGCGANVRAFSRDKEGNIGRTALHWAAAKGKVEAVGILLKAGADVNEVDDSGWTALHCALMHGHVTTAANLITKYKADKSIEDRIGRTAERYCSPLVWAELDATTVNKSKSRKTPSSTIGSASKPFFGGK